MVDKIQIAREYLKIFKKGLLSRKNVVSVGVGYKVVNGYETKQVGIICSVAKKVPMSLLSVEDQIPQTIGEIPTDVVETGEFKFLENTARVRPAVPGYSIGHKDITAGTFGCVVKRNGVRHILSNNHVLANINQGKIGDEILQPGSYDGGTVENDTIALLADYEPIKISGGSNCTVAKTIVKILNSIAKFFGRNTRIRVEGEESSINLIDSAIALPLNDSDISDEIYQLGKPVGIKEAKLNMMVQKMGRTTEKTSSIVTQIDVTARVMMGENEFALFEDQIMTGYMSAGGDSGSAILDMGKNLVGLLFAGSESNTIFCRIQNVFEILDLTL